MSNLNDWDITAANNNDAPPDGWPENTMQYSEVNNTAREGMAVMARFWKDINGSLQFAGAANIYTVTLNAGYVAYFQGMAFLAEINVTNTGATTINVNGLGAKTLQTQAGDAMSNASLVAGGVYEFRYDGTVFQLMGGGVADGGVTTVKLADEAVTLPKLLHIATDSFLGRDTAATGDVEVLTATQVRTIINVENGSTADQTSIVGITGTTAQFNTANTDGTFVTTGGAFHDGFSDFVADEHVAHAGVDFIAGTGMTGGGTIAATRTFNVIGGDGITANANDMAVDSTVIRTTGAQTLGGQKTFTTHVRSVLGTAAIPAYVTTDLDTGWLSGGVNIIHWSCGNNIRMTLSAVGALVCDDDITAFSDERLKDNLEIIPNALDKIMQLNGYTFDRIDHFCADTGKSLDTRRHAGVIAQEVAKVLPEVISENDDGVLGTAYGNMAALFIEAIKELTGRVAELEAA